MTKIFSSAVWFGQRFLTSACVIAGVHTTSAMAGNMHILHVFCRDFQCGDGDISTMSMVMDAAGNLYGTASEGSHGAGVVFELSPPQTGETKWAYHVLYNFCSRDACKDGNDPTESILIRDTSGNLYGTTVKGGSRDSGTAFMLSPQGGEKYWKLHVIYDFCSRRQLCSDGIYPTGGLTYLGAETGALYDGASPLYGEAHEGGKHFGGTVFEIDPSGQGLWAETTRYSFCHGGKNCSDGAAPAGGLSIDGSGNLYGLTVAGSGASYGVAFKLTPHEGVKTWTESVIYNFCSQTNCTDGLLPTSRLLVDVSGNLFGTTEIGGSHNSGVLYEISATGTYSVLHSFCQDQYCSDGSTPINSGGLVMDSSGNIFGATDQGGCMDCFGTIFEWNGSSLQKLHRFEKSSKKGIAPQGGLTIDGSGNLYGTAANSIRERGTAFELTR